MKNKTVLRILSTGLLVAFGLQDLAWAEGVSGGVSWPAARKNGPIHLSKTLASSSQGSEGRSDWKIIHIQDAHDSLEAQRKIGGILETLVSEYDIRSVALEGSGGDIDPSLFKTYPDKAWAERSANRLVEEGKLNAGEFFAITSKKPVSVYGVEERTLYRENLKAFRDLLLQKEKIDRDLKGLSKTLETLSERIYSEKIKWIRSHSLLSDTSNLSFPKKWEAFEALAKEKNIDLRTYPSLSLLAGAAALEDRIDFKRANQEREALFSELKNTLKGAELEDLLERSIRFKAGEISDLEFYQFLSTLARASSSDSARYSNLIAYIEYLQYFDTLDLADVLKEFEVFETSLKDAFFVSDDERVLHRLERECHLITNLLSGSATSAEFERFKREYSRARFESTRKEILGLTTRYSVPLYEGFEFKRLLSSLPKAIRFYTLAKNRDAVLMRNTLKRMRKDGQRVAALVTGGFHGEGISELLKRNELSYLVVLPSVEDPSKKRPYMTILTRRRGQYERELAGPASRYKVVLGTSLDTALANPYAKVEEILEPLAEGLRSAGQNAGARLARWMDDYERATRENKIRHSKALEPRNVRKSLEKMLGRHGEKRPEAARGARLAEAGDFIADNKVNFDPRFNYRILKLAEKDPKDWTEDERKEYEALRQEIEKAHDWTRQEISRYPSLIGHPPALLSLEGIVSAVERGKGPRLTSYHGGLGVLFGEWIRGIAYLGGVTTLDPDSQAPEFHIFIPDYEEGVTTSRVHAFGYPTLGARQIQRPQDHGIDFMKDPKDPSQPLQISIPLYDSGESIYIRFRAVKIGALKLLMPATDFEANHPAVRRIFEELYKGKPSSRERFEQEWVAGLAAFEFRKKMGIPLDGPVHLNETATFPYLIGLIRHYMEEGYTYEESLRLVGSQLVFFTHTLVAAGIDHFHEDGVKMGHYIRSYFEKSSSEEVRKQAGNVARDMIHGRRSEDGKLYLPGFEESHRRNVYSPLHFVVRLAHSFNGTVVAVSQLNAIEAGKFFIQQGIITPEENARKPVLGITNGVDHLFWMIREIRDVMNWQESDPAKRTPERVLDPDDPEARRLAGLFDRVKEFGSIGEEPVLKDETLFEKLYENKKLAVEMVRSTVRDQYIRETGFIEEATRQNHVTHEELERLHVLRVRWARWIGKEDPEEWVKSWEGRPFEEQETFRQELHAGELKGLMDPDLFLGVWARRIVNYKRILFTIFGHFLPEVEAQMPPDHALSPKELDDIILRLKNKGALNQFIELVVKKKAQFIFAGKAFSEDGRSSVALIHRLIELLSKDHPEFQDRVLFLEGYDETKSQYLVRGADTWINTPKRPLEASGTSGMKVAKGDIYASPNGDGWGAGGIEDKLNGRVKGIVGTRQDHPDTWPASERENASNVSYYLGQEAAHFYEMMSEEVDSYNKAMAYFLKKDENQRFNAIEWLQRIRRWVYFTALVYDIRGEFTGRRVPSFRPEDVPGGDERGIFSLYEEAIAKTQALKRSIHEEKKAQGARLADHRRSPKSMVAQVLHKLHEAKTHYDHAVHLAVSRNTIKGSALETMLQKFNNSGTLRYGSSWYDSFYPVMWKDVFTDLDVEFYKPDPDYFSVYTFLSITIAKTRPFMIFVDESTPAYLGMSTEAVRTGFLKAWKDGEAKLREALEIIKQVIPADDRMPLSSGTGRVVDDLREASGLFRRMLRIYIHKAWGKELSRRNQILDIVQDFNVTAASPVPDKPRENFVVGLLETVTRIEDVETILSNYPDTPSVSEEAARTLEYILKEKIRPIQEEVQGLQVSKPEFKDFSMLYFALLSSHVQGASQKLTDAVEKLREGDSERVQGARLAVSSDPRIQKTIQGMAYFEKEFEYILADARISKKNGDWKMAAERLKDNLANAKRSTEQGRIHDAWGELKSAWGQFDVVPAGEFVIGDYSVRRRSFEELFLSWAKAVDPVYAYYLMAAFAIRELEAVENKVKEGDFVSRSFVIRQIENLGRRLKKLQRLVLQILATGKYSEIDPSEVDAVLFAIEKEIASLETSGERAVRTVYANDRNKVFANVKLDDPSAPVTSSFFRLIQDMKSYSDSRPKGARLATNPSPEVKVLLERLLQTAEKIRGSKSDEMRVRLALEFLDSVPFKLTVVVDAEIERLLGLEGVNRRPYREALEAIQSVFSGMNAEDRAKALRFVVKPADSTRGNIIIGLVRPIRENLSGARLALTDSATLGALKFTELKKSFLSAQEHLDQARRERAFADQAYFAAFADSLKGVLTLMGAGGIVVYFAWHAQTIVAGFGAGLFWVLFKTRAHAKKKFEIEETLRALYQEEAALRSAVLRRFNGKLDYPHGENARLALTAVDKIVNADPKNPNRPNLSKRVDTLLKKLVRYDSRSRTAHKPFSSKAHRAAVDQYQMDVERRMDALYLDAAEYIETRGESQRLAADIEVFDVVGASRAVDRFLDADSRGVSSDDRFSGARLAAIDYLTGGAVSAVLYQARIWNLGHVLDSIWTSHERSGFIRKTPAENDIRKRVGPYTIGQIDMSAKYRGTLKEISLKDFAEFARAYGFETPLLVLKSMVRDIRARISPPLTRQCPLCEANFPLSENAFHWKGNYRWNVTPNPFPILDGPKDRHFVIGSADHTPQVLDERSIEDMVRFAREAKDYRVFFNGIGAGASIPRHRHIQAVTYPFPIENEYYFPIETVKRDKEVFTYRVRNYPRELYAFQSSNETLLAKTIYEKVAVLQAHQIPHDLLLVRQDYGPVRAYLFALNPKRRYGFSGAHQAAGYIFSPAKNAAGEPIDLFDRLDPDAYSGDPSEKEAQALESIRGYLRDALHPFEMWELLKAPAENVPASTVEGARMAVDQESQALEKTIVVERPGKEPVKVRIQKSHDPDSILSDTARLILSVDREGADTVSVSFDRPLNETPEELAALVDRYIRDNDLPFAFHGTPESEERIQEMVSRELDMIEDLYTIERDPRGVNYDQVNYFVDEFYRLLEGRLFHNHSPSNGQGETIRKELREILEESIKNAFESIQVRFMHEDDIALQGVPAGKRPAQKGEIHVYLVPKGERLMFQIVDDGMGVHPEVLKLTEKEYENREELKEWTGEWMERWDKYYQSTIKQNNPGQFLKLSGQGQGLLMIEHFSHDKLIQGKWTLKDRVKELGDKTGAIFTYNFNFHHSVEKRNGGARLAKTSDYKAALDKITASFSDGIDSFLRNPSLTEVSLESMLQYENQKITDLIASAQRGAARKELSARIKTVLIAKNFEPTSNPDIYRVPAIVRQKLLRSQKSGARLAQGQSVVQSLRQTYLKMQSAFNDELKADAPSADVIVVTAYDDRMKKLYEEHLARLSGVTYRRDVPVLVVTNPSLNGRVWSAGSGGMIARSLRAVDDSLQSLKESHPHLRAKKSLEDLNILIVQGGGLGERMLFSALLGSKTLTPLPVSLGDGRQATLLDLAMMAGPAYTQALAKKGQPGVVTLAGDIVSITKPQLKDGLNLLSAPKSPAEIDRRLGVIAQDPGGQVYFIEKPSLEQIALDPRLRGKRYLLANAANSVLTHSDKTAYRRALDSLLRLEAVMSGELENTGTLFPVDTSIDLLEPRAARSAKEALTKRSEDDEERKEYYAQIYRIVREGLPDLVVPRQSPSFSYFIDFASVSDWFDVMDSQSVLSQVFGRSFVSSDRAVLHKITPARGEGRWKYLLFGIGRSMAYVSDEHVMLKIPVKTAQTDGTAIVYADLKDRLEKTVEKGMLFGKPASRMLDSWRVPYSPYDSLLDVPAWPVVPANLHGHLAAIQGLSKGRPADLYGYLPKMSIRQIQRSVDQGAPALPAGGRLAETEELARSRWMDEVTVKKDASQTPQDPIDGRMTFERLTERLRVFENDTPDNNVHSLEVEELDARVASLRQFKKKVLDHLAIAAGAEKRDSEFYLAETARLETEAEVQRNILNFYSFSGDEQRLITAAGWAVLGRRDLADQALLSDAVARPSLAVVRAFVSVEGVRFLGSDDLEDLLIRYERNLSDKDHIDDRMVGKDYRTALKALKTDPNKNALLKIIAARVEPGDRVRMEGDEVVRLESILKGQILYRTETGEDNERRILERKTLEDGLRSGLYQLLPKIAGAPAPQSGARLAKIPVVAAVRTHAAASAVRRALPGRSDVEIVSLYPHTNRERMLAQLEAATTALNASFAIVLDDEDPNEKAKIEFLKRFHEMDLRARPILAGLLDGRVEITRLSDAEKKALLEDLFKILPAIAPRSWSGTETRSMNVKELWLDTRLQLFHPSFGSTIGELPGFADKSPRAAVWSLDTLLKDPILLRSLEDRDKKLSGRMRVDDYLLADTADEKALEKRFAQILGEESAKRILTRFTGRVISSGSAFNAGGIAQKLITDKGYKPEYILFVDLDEKRTVQRSKDQKTYQVLYLRSEYTLTLDKVATQILAAGTGAKNLFIKGLQIDEEGNYIFTPLLPIDYERHFRDFYTSLKQILRSA